MHYLINLFIKRRYGVLRTLRVKIDGATHIAHFTLVTYIGNRYAGVLTQEQLAAIEAWLVEGKLKTDSVILEDITEINYSRSSKAWDFRDYFRFRAFSKPSGNLAEFVR